MSAPNIDPATCETCGGCGEKVYGSTAGPWGGAGGMTMTTFDCPACNGSGTAPTIVTPVDLQGDA